MLFRGTFSGGVLPSTPVSDPFEEHPGCYSVELLVGVSFPPLLFLTLLKNTLHGTKFQESVNGNVTETCETDPEIRRITCVSVSGFVTFTHVSFAAYTAEPDHFLAFPFRKRDGIT